MVDRHYILYDVSSFVVVTFRSLSSSVPWLLIHRYTSMDYEPSGCRRSGSVRKLSEDWSSSSSEFA